ncbi:MAG TPA: spore coat U domain-containing protein [Steroidobacteraceae bacterium]|jgi:spore coat protein U-like protein|nr:spore coat U domain-containing protein [Steroidobacteraceae bacterium]
MSAALPSCSVNTLSVLFGTYDTLSGLNVDAVGNVTVTCTAADSYSIALSSGNGSFAARQLQSGAGLLYYNLYTDTSRTSVWGDGSGGTAFVPGSGTTGSFPVYGRIPGRQNVAAGTYGDTITVTLTF